MAETSLPAMRSPRWLDLRRAVLALLFIGLAAVPYVAMAVDEPFYIGLFTRIMIFALAAISLDLILGYGGMVSLGHAAFVGIGAYVVGILSVHAFEGSPVMTWPIVIGGTESAFIAWPLAILASALAAFLIGLVSLRTGGVYFIMITLAFAQMFYYFFISLQRYGGEDGMTLWGRSDTGGLVNLNDRVSFYYLVLVVLGAVLFVSWRLVNSRFGMVIQGIRQNERRMRAIGYPTYRYKLACFVISGAIAGLAGALMANQTEFVSPAYMHWTRSGEILIMVVLGGMGTLFGPIVGAAAFLLLEEILSSYTMHWQIVFGPALILVVLFAKRGIYGSLPARDSRRDE